MTIAIYPGSFDPFTNGHLDILKSGSEIFDRVIIAVSYNSDKKAFLPIETRVELIKEAVSSLNNVEVDSYNGLTAEYAKAKGANVLLRGLRNSIDFEYELNLSHANNALNNDLKTIFLATKPENCFISSSMIRELLKYNGDITPFVPQNIYNFLTTRDI